MRRLLITPFTVIIFHFSFLISNCLAEITWQSIGPFGGNVLTLAIDPTNSQTVYAGTWGGIFKSTNGGESWLSVNSGMGSVYSIAIDPNNSQIVYIGGSGVHKSTDSGTSWTAINSGMKNDLEVILAIDPANSQIVYAGTWGGVFKSINVGLSWETFGNELTHKRIVSLAIDPSNSRVIYVGTDGDGIFKTLLSDDVPIITGTRAVTFSEDSSGNFRIGAPGWPAPQFSISGIVGMPEAIYILQKAAGVR